MEKEAKTRVVIVVFILIVCAYYIGQSSRSTSLDVSTKENEPIQQQTPEMKQNDLMNQKQCSKDGSDYNINFWHSTDNNNASGMKNVWDSPEYHYSSKLNTCLLYERYVQFDKYNFVISYQNNQIIDVYANKVILAGFFIRDVSVTPYKESLSGNSYNGAPNYTSEKFFRQKNMLFSQ